MTYVHCLSVPGTSLDLDTLGAVSQIILAPTIPSSGSGLVGTWKAFAVCKTLSSPHPSLPAPSTHQRFCNACGHLCSSVSLLPPPCQLRQPATSHLYLWALVGARLTASAQRFRILKVRKDLRNHVTQPRGGGPPSLPCC